MEKRKATKAPNSSKVIPLFGKDEMNLIEFPLGPITPSGSNVIEVDHVVRDPATKREVTRRLIVRGAEGLGLPRPIDDRVLVGMMAITHEASFTSQEVWFSRYHLCGTIGWSPDGKSYRRLEECFDRIAGTTLKFKDAWWDKAEQEWRSQTFHLIDNVELCSKDRYHKARTKTGRSEQPLCFFRWNDVVWKSFQDGYIRTLDMEMFRKVSNGYRRDVPTRLFRWLGKRFWKLDVVTFDVMKLSQGTLGISVNYPSEAIRAIERASRVLVDCGFLDSVRFRDGRNGKPEVVFVKKRPKSVARKTLPGTLLGTKVEVRTDATLEWLASYTSAELEAAENEAIQSDFGTTLERSFTEKEQKAGKSIRESGFVRQGFIKRYLESKAKPTSTAA